MPYIPQDRRADVLAEMREHGTHWTPKNAGDLNFAVTCFIDLIHLASTSHQLPSAIDRNPSTKPGTHFVFYHCLRWQIDIIPQGTHDFFLCMPRL